MSIDQNTPEASELGRRSDYDRQHNPERLYPISRNTKREELGVDPTHLPFKGFDWWTHYEVSWLNEKGKPMVAIAEIIYDCTSSCIIESKSMKLYFNSLNQSKFQSITQVGNIIKKDLETILRTTVSVKLFSVNEFIQATVKNQFAGVCIDDLDIDCSVYQVEPAFLQIEGNEVVSESLYSDLLKSNCLVTGQPDWASVLIQYQGKKISRSGLLRYLVSLREHNEFHEQCIERIFIDIMRHCQPEKLTVYGRYTRRGGLDINPYRSTEKVDLKSIQGRLVRQ